MSTNLFVCVPSKANLNHEADNEVFATFTFNPPAFDASKRPPLDIGVALDVSGSMQGAKLEAAKASLLKLIEHLTDRDHLAVATFDTHVEVVLTGTAMTAQAKADARSKIAQLRSGSSTNLSGGVLQALTLLKDRKVGKDTVRRCMVFTDGRQNQGIRDPKQLIDAVSEFRSGIGISTFGYGDDHDPELLASLAMDGGFYYIDTPDKILSAFGTELGGLLSTFAQNVELRVDPAEGVEIVEVLNDLSVTQDGKAAVIRCDDLLAEQPYTVVLSLKVGKRDNAFPRDVAVAHARAKFYDVAGKRPGEETVALKVRFVKPGAEDKEHDKAVLNAVAYQKSIRAQAQALAAASAGNLADARQVLADFAVLARGIGTDEANELGLMSEGLVAEAYGDHQMYATRGAKLGSSTRRAMARGRDFGDHLVGGVNLGARYGSRVQQETSRAFTGKAPTPAPEPPKAATPAPTRAPAVPPQKKTAEPEASQSSGSFSKSRSNRW